METEFTQMRLEWLEGEISTTSTRIRSIQAQIDRLEGFKAKYTNYLDGLEAEKQDIAETRYETA